MTRKWKLDDVAAVFSWFGIGSLLFVVAGTTSAVSLVLVTANSTTLKDYLSEQISVYLSRVTGFEVSFESAVVPNWKDGTIRLTNVSILCTGDTWSRRVLAQRIKDAPSASSRTIHAEDDESTVQPEKSLSTSTSDIDLNWTYWDLHVHTIDVSLSLWRYWQGLGLVSACKMSGVRGVADRMHIVWPPGWTPTRREPTPADFSMDEFVVEDLLVTVKNPEGSRPYNVSVYSARLGLFRQQWMLYDIMCAESIVGAFDNCLFSVRKWKVGGNNNGQLQVDPKNLGAEMSHCKINGLPIEHFSSTVTGPFSWITNGSIDIDFHFLFPQHQDDQIFAQIRQEFDQVKYIAMDKLEELRERYQKSGVIVSSDEKAEAKLKRTGGVLSQSGITDSGMRALMKENVVSSTNPLRTLRPLKMTTPKKVRDERTGVEYIEADAEAEEDNQLIETYEPRQYPSRYTVGQNQMSPEFKPSVEDTAGINESGAPQLLFMHWAICLNDLKASVPLSTPHISYMNNALIRPIVGYMNSHRVRIPLTFEARTELTNFDGSWDFFSAGLIDIAAEEIGRALTLLVLDERERTRHLKRIGLWSIQNATKNLMEVVDFIRGVHIPQRAFL
ncbi:Mitochondrial distribution and morphology protein 31, mitochondrial precursor [Physocladia obscura]|uniref:Mitochondrial distribution and morphology protein 31, mitochondrial n=1 Tax=Physocladia obscura TaxID=109957 RepID=A0AAD5T949_9FUNG|nr:Mitochondrial distribution and morphology protein 31, mitochondrial precursor [Physocladia obscura]